MNEKIKISKVVNYAGAFIALLIGSGFATGQELMQFFSSYGLVGMIGVCICFVALAFVGVQFVKYGFEEKFDNPNDIYKHICGKGLGTFYDYFSIFFIFLSFTVMISGAQATAVQHYNAPPFVGGIVLGALAIITVMCGLNRIVDVIGKIGPVIVILAILVGLISISKNISNLDSSLEALKIFVEKKQINQASNFGFVASALSYVGFCMLWLAAFCATVGKNSSNLKETKYGQILGAAGFSLATIIMAFAILLSINEVHSSQIPSLILASDINPLFANIFSIFIILGIYTTAVPLLWTVIARFFEENTKKFRLATLIIGILGMVIGLLLKFDILVKYVYVLNGYLGIILLFIMVVRAIMKK